MSSEKETNIKLTIESSTNNTNDTNDTNDTNKPKKKQYTNQKKSQKTS